MNGWDKLVQDMGVEKKQTKQPAAQSSSSGWDSLMRDMANTPTSKPPVTIQQQPTSEPQTTVLPEQTTQDEPFQLRMAKKSAAGEFPEKPAGRDILSRLTEQYANTPLAEIDKRVREQRQQKKEAAESSDYEDYLKGLEREQAAFRNSGLTAEEWYAKRKAEADALGEKSHKATTASLLDRLSEAVNMGNVVSYADAQNKTAADNMTAEERTKAYNDAKKALSYAETFRWDDTKNAADFEAKAAAGLADVEQRRTEAKEKTERAASGAGLSEGGVFADSMSRIATAPTMGMPSFGNQIMAMRESIPLDELPTDDWTDEQKKIYGYLHARDVENGTSDASDYGRGINNQINRKKRYNEIKAKVGASSNGKLAAQTVAARAAGLAGGGDWFQKLLEYNTKGYTTETPFMTPGTYAQAVDSEAGQRLNDWSGTIDENSKLLQAVGLSGKGVGDVYQLGMSAIDSVIAANAMGEVGSLALFFSKAASSGYNEAIDRGADPAAALTYGFAQGAAEALFEKFSVESLLSKNVSPSFIKRFLKQGGVEMSEEGCTSIANALNDVLFLKEKGSFEGQIQSLVETGASYEDAEKSALRTALGNVVSDSLGGFISGGMSESMQSVGRSMAGYNAAMRDRNAAVTEASEQNAQETTPQNAAESPTSEGDIPAPAEAETAPTVESSPPTVESAAEETATVETPQTEAAQTAPEQTATQPTAAEEIAPVEQNANGKTVERGFSENVRTDENMEQELRDDFTNDPDYYTQLSNKETLGKAQKIFAEGLDTARSAVEEALANAKAGKKLSPEIVPLTRMVANEMTRNGEKESARRILSDLAVELTQAGQLGQAAKILRSTDAQTALKTVQKALDKINAEIKKKRGNRAKWTAELTESEIEMLNNIDMGDEAAFQEAYKQIANRIGKEMPATLWEKVTELRRINMLLKPRTQIRNFASNAPMVLLRKGAETMSGAIQDEMVKLGVMDKAQQTRTLKVSDETKAAAKEYYKANKDTLLADSNKWDMNTLLRESRTYFKGGALEKAISKLSGKEQQALLEQARRFTYTLLEKGDAPFVQSAFVDSLAQYMSAKGLTDFNNVPQEAIDFAKANAFEATFKNASSVANFINQIKRNGGALGKALDVIFPFTTTPANIFNLMVKYSPAGFADTITKAVKKANAPDIIDSASKASVGSAVFGLGLLLRSLGAITGKPDDDEDKRALDKATGKSPYSIAGRWSYDWAQPVGSLLVLGAETWDAIQGQEGVGDAIMNAIYSAGDSALNMSLFQNVTSMLKGYGSNTEKILNAIIEGGGTQLVPGLAGDIAALIDDTVRSSYTGGNVFQNTLAKMGMNIPGLSKTLPASVNVKGEENKRGPLWFRGLERLVDPGTYNRNEMTDSDRAIYDLYEDTNDKTIFPRVAPASFDYGGETYRMTGDERAQFQTTQGQIYYEMLDAMLDSGEWDDMSRAAKVKMLQDAAAYATDEAKRELVETRGGEYKSSDWEGISTFADGDSELASQILSVRNEAKKAIESGEPDILDRLLGKDGAYNNLSDEAKDLLNVKQLGHIVDMHDNGLDAAGALTVLDALAAAKTARGDGKDLTQQQTVDAIIGTDLTEKEKLSAIKAYTSEAYMEELQAAVDSGVSLEKLSEVRNKYAEIKEAEGLTATQKATQFAAALDKDKSLTEKQRQVLREQLTYYSMSAAEAKRYDELTDTGMSIDTATKVTDLLASVKPLEGKTSVTQLQRADAIANGGLSPGDTWAALKVYTGESFYNKAAEAYKKGIDLDDYISNFKAVDTNDSGDLTQAELYAFYKQNPKQNETYCKIMLSILSSTKSWDKFLKEQEKAAKKKAS